MTGLSPPGIVLAPAVASLPGARVHLVSNENYNNGDSVQFDALDYDSNGFVTLGSVNVFTIPSGLGGVYLIGFNTDVAGAWTGTLGVTIKPSDKDDAICGTYSPNIGNPLVTLCGTWKTVPGTTIAVRVFPSSDPVALSGNNDTSFWIVRLSP